MIVLLNDCNSKSWNITQKHYPIIINSNILDIETVVVITDILLTIIIANL